MPETTTSVLTTTNDTTPPPEIHKIHTLEHPLSASQRLAIHLLLLGQTDQQVADSVHLERSSITRWRLYHPTFRAELNRQREALWLNHVDRIRAMAATALSVLQNHLSSPTERSSFRAAINILKLAARFSPPPGPTDEYQLLKEYFLAEHHEKERYRFQMDWPPSKKDLDDLREYFVRKSANQPFILPPDPSPHPQQPLTPASLPQ